MKPSPSESEKQKSGTDLLIGLLKDSNHMSSVEEQHKIGKLWAKAAEKPRHPRLSTITMVERTIKESYELLSRSQLWKALPRKIMYSTFKEIMNYLEASNRIIYDKNRKIVWIAADNAKLKKFLKSSAKLRG